MENLLFYTLTVLIWGSTWLAIKFQLGTIDPLVSVIYRFTLAATLLMAWCLIKRLKMRFTPREHGFMALQGTLLFSINYWLFSTIVVMNMVNGNLFLKTPFDPRVIAGGTLGLIGIIFVFKPELSSFHFADSGIKGMVLCLIATYCASLGNIISARNQKNGLPIIQSNAYGMTYGTILMLAVALIKGKEFEFIFSTSYVTALIYLALFGSIVAFGCYLTLIGRIGADRASYATLLFPIVALAISTIWENYHWSHEAFIGVALILFGNLLMLRKRKKSIRAELLT